jgi:glycosyltransferase involved in cell wall biosynthesis
LIQYKKNKLKITFVCTNADLAGAPIHVRSLIYAFHKELIVEAVFGENGPIVDDLRSIGVKCHVLKKMKSNISPLNDLIVIIHLIKIFLSSSPDIVHLHSSKAAMLGRIACGLVKIPWVYTVHGWGWRGFGKIKAIVIIIIEKILSYTPKGTYIYVSHSVELEAIKRLNIKSIPNIVIYNGVFDFGYYPEPKGILRILMVARVTTAKDHETLLRAFEQVKIPSQLILCGEGTDSKYFQDKVKECSPNRFTDVELLGVRNDVRSLLNSANIFALISNFEALPISIIEAMSCARAVIATNVGGVTELIEHEFSGLIVPCRDVKKVTYSIECLAEDERRHRLGCAARASYEEKFKEDNMITAVLNVYGKIITRYSK